ncbi:5-carboxymethyl-2-hydroxymuconate isomerase [Roseicyclus sp. F158]|uniref:5-carboxymethyl-2-hydroxymuconate isomerase n=1 Tax=Tropicimonas omnivorans TaxID=3075590 RepID=A0ABU3DH63_9RHOB|nr:5-carboxymethyl-2-hydroxymuconate isomerase [Roseicyclus sp. F158]MDT0683060.1 5-carboxymethyl-2-hydroxymuconate isomerase [Roseicyclus sp. F158]
MPHIHIEYSANLDGAVDMGTVCEAIRAAAAGIEAFPMPGIRVRAIRVDHVAMADGDPKHGFVDLSVRLRAGRSDAVKSDALAKIFAALETAMTPVLAARSVALSAEIRDIDAGLSLKSGNVRDHLEEAQ